jgi:hypothetical protein
VRFLLAGEKARYTALAERYRGRLEAFSSVKTPFC